MTIVIKSILVSAVIKIILLIRVIKKTRIVIKTSLMTKVIKKSSKENESLNETVIKYVNDGLNELSYVLRMTEQHQQTKPTVCRVYLLFYLFIYFLSHINLQF